MELFKLLMSAFIFCINLIHCNHEQYQDGRLSTFEPENIVVEINSFIFFKENVLHFMLMSYVYLQRITPLKLHDSHTEKKDLL